MSGESGEQGARRGRGREHTERGGWVQRARNKVSEGRLVLERGWGDWKAESTNDKTDEPTARRQQDSQDSARSFGGEPRQ